MVIYLASFPRSGNTLFRTVLYSVFGINTYTIYDGKKLEKMSDVIGYSKLPNNYKASRVIFFTKTHKFPVYEDKTPAVYIIRDGRDALVSLAKYTTTIGKFKDRHWLDELHRVTSNGMGWSYHVKTWSLNCDIIVKFEDLIKYPVSTVGSVLRFYGISDDAKGEMPTFEELHKRWPEFFRKGKVGTWKEEMPEDIQNIFDRVHGETSEMLGYKW